MVVAPGVVTLAGVSPDWRRPTSEETRMNILVKHRHVIRANLDREHMSFAELRAALRKEGISTMSEVRSPSSEKTDT